jgi:Pup-ligase protein
MGFFPRTGRLGRRCRLVGGGKMTAVEMLAAITDDLVSLYQSGRIPEDIVPGTARVLPIWQRMLRALAEGDLTTLSKDFDWALKYMILDRETTQNGLSWNSDELSLVNQLYSHIDRRIGLYWPFLDSGYVEQCVTPESISKMREAGPEDTRAYARKAIIDKFGDSVCSVDWSRVTLKLNGGGGHYGERRVIEFEDLGSHTRTSVGEILDSCGTAEELCTALGASSPYRPLSNLWPSHRGTAQDQKYEPRPVGRLGAKDTCRDLVVATDQNGNREKGGAEE